MEKIDKGIVFSNDIERIFNGINSFDFKYECVPDSSIINNVRSDFKSEVERIFNGEVSIISEEEMLEVNNLIKGDYPIVTLDKIYITPDEENIYFLDCTRINGTSDVVSRKGTLIDYQIESLSNKLMNKKIILADDVVFTGGVLKNIIQMFKKYGVEVVGIITSISTTESYNYFNSRLKNGLKTNYLMSEDVIDQICERDFYFGVAGSGIMVKRNGELYKSPYFKPFGDPNKRASIPTAYEDYFSIGCLNRSAYLWQEIDKLKKLKTKISELPERIINTNENEEVVKTLKKEMERK